MSNELADVQRDIALVKKALQDGTDYLGMRGEMLAEHFRTLNEKENLIYKMQLQAGSGLMALGGGSAIVGSNGAGIARAVVQVPTVPAREPPPGPTQVYNKEDVGEIVVHMTNYEAVAAEGAKAMRALSSLAYSDAGRVGGDARVLPQLLRLLALHPDDANTKICAMRVLCNMAYDQEVSKNKLTDPGVLSALLATLPEPEVAEKGKGGEAATKAGEALARIVAAEVNPEGNGTDSIKKSPATADGSLARVFIAAASGEAAWQSRIPQLVKQLVANEVCEPKDIAERFALVGKSVSGSAAASIGWMSLAKLLAAMEQLLPPNNLSVPQSLVDIGAIRVAVQIMEAQASEGTVQLAGVEAMSALVGNRWGGLLAFAEVGGMKRIEAALSTHTEEPVLQTKGMRALASGIGWPEDVQKKAGYNYAASLDITLAAMKKHGQAQELLVAGLEALVKYCNKHPEAKDKVKEAGGPELVKAIMQQFPDVKQVQDLGNKLVGIPPS